MSTDLPTGTTVELEPNYAAMFARFSSVLPGEADQLLHQMKRALRPHSPINLKPLTFLQLWENAEATLAAFHDWLGPLAVAFQCAVTEQNVVVLRDHISDVLAKVAAARQERDL